MKPHLLIVIIFLGITLITCEENTSNQEYPFEAKVIGRNTDCGLFAIQFTSGIQQANEIAGTLFTEYIFIAKNLPTELQVEGLSISLNIRRIQETDLSICTTMGPSYPWVYVLEARKKE